MLPSASNPLVLQYRGRVPALKNEKNLVETPEGQKLIPNRDVLSFINRAKSLKSQVIKQGFEQIAFPTPVATYVQMWFSVQEKHGIPTSDGDNAYTTIQETWQDKGKVGTLGSVLGVIENDRQILSCRWDTYIAPIKELQGATAYLWAIDTNRDREEQWDEFSAWRRLAAAKKQEVDSNEIDFLSLDELF